MRTASPHTHLVLGRRGEQVAMHYLHEKCDMLALARNWRCSEGELDLVLIHPDTGTFIFCEVKTRTTPHFGSPADAVTPGKAHRIRRLARRWLHAQDAPHWIPHRFDLVSILWLPGQLPRINHIPAAF